MTPERAAALVAWWVRMYTRSLPAAIAGRRADEIGADVHDHIAHERARGASDWRIGLGILSRMLRGLPADASWRRRAARSKGHPMKLTHLLLAVVVAAVGVGAIMAAQADDAPGLGLIGFLFIFGAIALGARTVRRSRQP